MWKGGRLSETEKYDESLENPTSHENKCFSWQEVGSIAVGVLLFQKIFISNTKNQIRLKKRHDLFMFHLFFVQVCKYTQSFLTNNN